MTHVTKFGVDPFDIVWKNFFHPESTFSTFNQKINYPVDIYEIENGLRFELAVVGLDKEDIQIQVEGDILRVSYNKSENQNDNIYYIQKGIARRSFDLAWKIAIRFDLNKLNASMDKGLLIIDIPISESKTVKLIKIK